MNNFYDSPWLHLHGPPGPEESFISPEHVALVDFACRLGSFTTKEEPGIADASNMQQDAKLLMSLLTVHIVSDDVNSLSSAESHQNSNSSPSPSSHHPCHSPHGSNDHHYLSDADASTSSATTSTANSASSRSFRFRHPSLSLDGKWKARDDRPRKTPCPTTEVSSTTADEANDGSALPAVLLGRPLNVDDREAHRLSADAMARNLLQSFQKAIQWRIQAWMDALSTNLVQQEQAMKARNASIKEVQELLKTPQAQLFMQLQQAAKTIEVQHAETCFHVLPQRTEKPSEEEAVKEGPPVGKRRRIDSEDSLEGLTGSVCEEADYQYTVCHALEMDGTIHLLTPVGHSEIKIEVPGYIEGTFLSSMEHLMAVEVQLDTRILANMVEKACRIIVRSSVEHICQQHNRVKAALAKDMFDSVEGVADEEEQQDTEEPIKAAAISPLPQGTAATSDRAAAIVTPRAKVSPLLPESPSDGFLHIPHDLDSASSNPRRISPQPISTAIGNLVPYTTAVPTTPSKRPREALAMVSPPPACQIDQEDQDERENLPVLVEAAIQVNGQ